MRLNYKLLFVFLFFISGLIPNKMSGFVALQVRCVPLVTVQKYNNTKNGNNLFKCESRMTSRMNNTVSEFENNFFFYFRCVSNKRNMSYIEEKALTFFSCLLCSIFNVSSL